MRLNSILLLFLLPYIASAQSLNKKYIFKDFVPIRDGVYMQRHEVTNKDFRAFIQATNQTQSYDSTAWNKIYAPEWAKHYHWHEAFAHYPIVNISLAVSMAYCQWLTDLYNRDSGNERKVTIRLPSRAEWNEAFGETNENPSGNIAVRQETEINYVADGFLYQAPVMSFKANKKGLFDMVGNVSELLLDGTVAGSNYGHVQAERESIHGQSYTLPDPRVGLRLVMELSD